MTRSSTLTLFAVTILAMLASQQATATSPLIRQNERAEDNESAVLRKPARAVKSAKAETGRMMIRITNLTFNQPFSPFFVMTHNKKAGKLFTVGQPASGALGRLAEDGSTSQLEAMFRGQKGVGSVATFNTGAPYFGGQSAEIVVETSKNYPYVTIASMAINTNDCFVALNGVKVQPGDSIRTPGYDSGTEANDQICANIPGPACGGANAMGTSTGEGFVHIHRGVHTGVPGNTMPNPQNYDWRDNMIQFDVMSM